MLRATLIVAAVLAVVLAFVIRNRSGQSPAARAQHEMSENERVEAGTKAILESVEEQLRELPPASPESVSTESAVSFTEDDLSNMVQRAVKSALSGEIQKGDDITQEEISRLPIPPPSGSVLKSFNWLPHFPQKGAYMMWVESASNIKSIESHYLAAVQAKGDHHPAIKRNAPYIEIASKEANVEISITDYGDGVVSARVMYGAW